ncbi:hypothetical protein ACFX13_044511 [Malus domestica]
MDREDWEVESFTYWAIDFALILQRHGQYDALEEHRGLHGVLKERKVTAAVRCFFRASSGKGSSQALLSLPQEVGLPNLGFTGIGSAYAWRLHYYQWAMQTFEQYNICKDEESKYICLRRLINVLYERGAINIFQMLCGGQLPLIGLTEKVKQALARKADSSDILKPNLYYQHTSMVLKEILNGLSAAINALHLIHPACAWIGPLFERSSLHNELYPSKIAKFKIDRQASSDDGYPQTRKSYIDIEKLEDEFVLTSAEYLLSPAHVKSTPSGTQKAPLEVVDLLIQTNLYDLAFTVLLRFFKGSQLKRGLERAFFATALKCCSNGVDSSLVGDGHRAPNAPNEYVNYGRYREARNLLLEYKIICKDETAFAVWSPYTSVELLWCQLEECISSGHMIYRCNMLKNLLHGALLSQRRLRRRNGKK